MLVIVPNELRDFIFRKIDLELENSPSLKPHRDKIYLDILSYYNEHGVIPGFKISTRDNP